MGAPNSLQMKLLDFDFHKSTPFPVSSDAFFGKILTLSFSTEVADFGEFSRAVSLSLLSFGKHE